MSFAWPLMLLALLVVPLAGVGYWLMQRRRNKYAVRFTNLDLLANVVDQSPGWKRHVPPALYLVALAALIGAVARPQTVLKIPKEEATVILVTDVSGSMLATDVEPTRLDAAKKSGNVLVDNLPDKFKMALIAFSNNVRTVVPPTDDRDLMRDGLAGLTSNGGTSMGDALMQAIDLAAPVQIPDGALPGGSATPGARTPTPTPTPKPTAADPKGPPAIIVLLSDGANSTGVTQPLDAAAEAQARGIPIFTIALGTQRGVVDITQNGITRRISVPPDEETLKEISEMTEGKFYSAPSADELDEVYKILGSKIGYDEEKREVTAAFAGGALAFMVVGAALSLLWFSKFP